MALVSYTQSALGQPMQFTMNKNELLSIPKVMADSIFKFESNWFRVSFVFKHTTSGKRFVPSFRTFSATKYLKLRSGMVDSDQFELKKIIISKSNRSHLVIKTNEIPDVASYMFSLSGSGEESSGGGGGSGGGSGGSNIPWSTDANYFLNSQNELQSNLTSTLASEALIFLSSTSYPIGSAIEFKYTVNSDIFLSGFTFLGLKSESGQYSGFYSDYQDNQLGINNNLNSSYSRPSNSVVEFKIRVTPTQTTFYVGGIEVQALSTIGSFNVTPAVRFNSTHNLKQFSVTQESDGVVKQIRNVVFDNISAEVTRSGNQVLVASGQPSQLCYSNTSLGPQGTDFDLTFNISNVDSASNNIELGFINVSGGLGFGSQTGYAGYKVILNRASLSAHLLDVNNNASGFSIPASSSYEVRLTGNVGFMSVYVNGVFGMSTTLNYGQFLSQRQPYCFSGANNSMTVSATILVPAVSTNSLGSFFDGNLSLNQSPFSKYSDSAFFSSANRFVSIGDYYHSQGGTVSFGGIPLKSATIDLVSGQLDAASADLFQDTRIKAIHHKSDLTKSWIIGQFGTEFNGTQLPALPAYNGTTFNSTNCFRVLEVNRSTGSVTHKLDIQTSYDDVGLGGSHYTMIDMKVDEATGDVFLFSGPQLVKYNFNTGPVWGKPTQIPYAPNEKYTHKLTLTADSVFVNVRNYDNVELTGYSWNNGGYVKVSRADGSRDTSFTIPVDGNYYPEVMRSISSDGSKVAYLIYDTSVSNLVAHTYSNGSWTKHSACQFGSGGVFGVIAESDYFYVLASASFYPNDKYIQKIDYSGNVVSTTFLNIGSNYYNNPSQYSFFKNGDKFYYRRYDHVLVKRDISTGAEETLDIPIAFDGNTQFTLSFVNNKVVVEVNNHQYQSFTFKDEAYLQIPATSNTIAVGVYNASTGELIKATAHAATEGFNQSTTRILKSNTITNKCWFVTYYGAIHEIDLATGNVTKLTDISLQAVPSHMLSATFVDGDYLYAIAGQTEISATDSTGTYTKNYMTRINLSTKLVDQSFSISNPSWGELTNRKVDVTDNFIYVTSIGVPSGYSKAMVRFRKSNFAVETIDYLATFPVGDIQYRQEFIGISKLDSTRIVVYGNKQYGANSGWAKPYLIFDEESMTPVASQPSFTGQPSASSYSAEFGKLVTISNTAANYWEQEISVYDVATETKTVYINGSQYQPSGSSAMFNGGYPSSILFFNDHIFIEMGYSSNSYKNKQYTGIIKVNSSGEVVND